MSDKLTTLPKNWANPSLEDLVFDPKSDIVDGPFGSNLKASEYTDTGVPIIRLQNVKANRFIEKNIRFIPSPKADELRRHSFRSGDIVISKLGDPLGEACIVPTTLDQGVLVADVVRVRVAENLIDKEAISYALNSDGVQKQLKALTKGTTRPRVNLSHIRGLRIPLPPRNEQIRIVAEIEKQFTRLDAAVAALKRVQANLKRYRAAVLKAACEGRLVPTEAEVARHEGRSYEPASALLERILSERRSQWKGNPAKYQSPDPPDSVPTSGLPDGWVAATVEQVSSLVQYGSSVKTNEDQEGIPVLRMGNLTIDGRLELTELKYLKKDHHEFPDLLLQSGDLLFNRTNSAELVGKSAVYRGNPAPCSFASYLIRVRTISGCDARYLALCLNSSLGRTWIKSVVSQQVGQANVNGTKLQSFVFPLPPEAEQNRILAEVDRKLSVIEEQELAIEQNLLRAERLGQSVLKRAFAGKLVPQDPNDEPAKILVERIRAERATNSNAGRVFRGRQRKEAAHVA